MISLYPHQLRGLELAEGKDHVALYWDMGTGKTYGGSELLKRYGLKANLVVCQKSKVEDWINHFINNYDYRVYNLTVPKELSEWYGLSMGERFYSVGVINYDLAWRREELLDLENFTLLLDESSLIQNEKAKRSKFILSMKPLHVILLSGTPTGGKYERLYSQLKLLGMRQSKTAYYNTYVNYHFEDYGVGAKVLTVDGYKNVDRLKRKMRELGCQFLKTEEVIDLPDQIFIPVTVKASTDYKKFKKDRVVTVEDKELVGDTTLTKLLYERQLCGQYSKDKLEAFKDLVESTDDRLIVFYNFTDEMLTLRSLVGDKPVSIVNGQYRDLKAYETEDNSVTFIQYQAGAMGLNLQKANKIIYYTPPLSSELYEQSKKRVNRIGQDKTCYYYNLTVKGSVEDRIYKTLEMRKDFTERLFEEVD